MKNEEFKTITEEEVSAWATDGCADTTIDFLTEILNGECSLNDARNDILSFR